MAVRAACVCVRARCAWCAPGVRALCACAVHEWAGEGREFTIDGTGVLRLHCVAAQNCVLSTGPPSIHFGPLLCAPPKGAAVTHALPLSPDTLETPQAHTNTWTLTQHAPFSHLPLRQGPPMKHQEQEGRALLALEKRPRAGRAPGHTQVLFNRPNPTAASLGFGGFWGLETPQAKTAPRLSRGPEVTDTCSPRLPPLRRATARPHGAECAPPALFLFSVPQTENNQPSQIRGIPLHSTPADLPDRGLVPSA